MMTTEELNRLANFGYTQSGSAIVDVLWLTQHYEVPSPRIGMVLICTSEGCWKAYAGNTNLSFSEREEAKFVAAHGAKLPCAIAQAAFPGRFEAKDYDT
jgi:hypothetical protein